MDAVVQLNTALAGRYEVDREIGAGGMATVYLARDVKHNRKVALKVLRPDLGAVLGVERFLSEIQVTANLQHPNLLPLFDSGEAGGQLFYVMPFVDGESLRARLDREKQLPVDEAVRFATAIASALGYAHDHGVIHRDLKPENILLQAGQPVIADFGIALAVSNAGAGRVTQTGISLGTPHYMSPEQATGDRAIDGRTDIYSLGAMTYEMLVGDPPYLGSTSQAVIAKVLTERAPSVRTARPNVPEHVDAAIAHALEKLPADRFATAREFGDAVSGRTIIATTATRSVGRPRGIRVQLLAPIPLVAIGVAVAATVFAIRERSTPAAPLPRVRFLVELADSVRFRSTAGTGISISTDGSMIAYTGGTPQRIYIRRLDQTEPYALAGTENGLGPVFSADGKWLAFFANGKHKKVPVTGGPIESLLDEAGQVLSWGDNDVIVSQRSPAADSSRSLWRVSPSGGPAEALVTIPDSGGASGTLSRPDVLPGSKVVVFQFIRRGPSEIAAARIGDSTIHRLGVRGTNPHYFDGYLLFGRYDGTIGAIAFDPSTLAVSGPEVTVLEDVAVRSGGAALFGVSRTGTLVYATGAYATRELITVERATGRVTSIGAPFDSYEGPRFSPDGKRIVVSIRQTGGESRTSAKNDLAIYDVVSKTLTRFTRDGSSSQPAWTPDGKRIAWRYSDSVRSEIRWQPWDQSAAPEVMLKSDSDPETGVSTINFSRTAPVVAYTVLAPTADLGMASVTAPHNPRVIFSTPYIDANPSISPDGKWVAYNSNASGAYEVYVRPFPGPGGVLKVSINGGLHPVWANNGTELIYRNNTTTLAATIGTTPELVVWRRDTLTVPDFATVPGIANYDVSADGKRLLGIVSLGSSDRIMVVQGWVAELREKMRLATKK